MENESKEHVVTYLSRLVGEPLTADSPVRLRSVHRAAFSSWARQQNVSVRLAVISSSVPFTIKELLAEGGETPAAVAATSLTPVMPAVPRSSSAGSRDRFAVPLSVGIDIEEVEDLPEAGDYRVHPFYEDNFTAAEISFCIRQPNVRASFCGSWAAKEAILKAGVGAAPAGHLKGIEILRDGAGRPFHPDCALSISHTARTAVAICMPLPGA